jgi:hypothetical protein
MGLMAGNQDYSGLSALRFLLRLKARARLLPRPFGGTKVHWTFVFFRFTPVPHPYGASVAGAPLFRAVPSSTIHASPRTPTQLANPRVLITSPNIAN